MADWQTAWAIAKLKSAKIFYSHNIIYVCDGSLGPNLQNLIPANISGYMVGRCIK